MNKRILRNVLSVLFILSLLTAMVGCGTAATGTAGESSKAPAEASVAAATESSTEAEAPPADIWAKGSEPIPITSFKISDVNLKYPAGMDMNNNLWNQLYKDTLNIEVNYLWSVPTEQSEAKINVNIASDDMPDISNVSKRQMKMMVDNGMVADLTGVFEQYASPLVKDALVNRDSHISLDESTIDGKLYALPFTQGAGGHPLLYIRTDWLANLGLQPPKSIDDLVMVADAFINKDPDKNGEKDTLGLSMTSEIGNPFGGGYGFFNGFNAYPYLGNFDGWLKGADGKIVNGSTQPEVKPALAKLADMYKAGLLDKEWATRDTAKILELAVSNKLGLIYSQNVLQFQWPFPSIRQTVPEADWRAYEIPTADGAPGKVMLGGSAANFFVVSARSKNPEAAVQMLNLYAKMQYIDSPDYVEDYHVKIFEDNEKYMTWQWAAIQNFGPGNTYVGAERIEEWFKNKNPDYMEKENPWIGDMIDQINMYLGMKPGNDNMWHWVTHMWMNPDDGIIPTVMQYNEQNRAFPTAYLGNDTQTMTEKGSTLLKMRDEVFTQIIMGAVDVDAFDKYVEDWHKLGGDQILEEINAK